MTRVEFWGQVFAALVPNRNCPECAAIADAALKEFDKRFEPGGSGELRAKVASMPERGRGGRHA